MEIRRGIGVSSGYALGEAFVCDREEFRIARRFIAPQEAAAEVDRLQKASAAAAAEVGARIDTIPANIRQVAGSILEAQVRMLQDRNLLGEIEADIRRHLHTAEYAASRTLNRKTKILDEAGAPAFAERVRSDLVELEKVLLRNLLGAQREDLAHLKGPVIVVAHELSPSRALGLDRSKVRGLLTEVGGPTSHTAIVAKSLGIPAVVGAEGVAGDISGGDIVILDGASGTVIVNPDEATLKRYRAMERNYLLLERQRAEELHDLPAVTLDGTRIQILANIESPEDIPGALELGAEGIGLYRTEYLYMNHEFNPSEQDHVDAYQRSISLLGGRRFVIRTMDLGADKMPHDGHPQEENPFLGTRGIRLSLERPEVFKAQLRAILKVSSLGNVGMMVPMISSLDEIRRVKEAVEDARAELRREGVGAGEGMHFGIMVEVPSAAVMADRLAPHVDFLSVGTNDLIAYSVAVDRSNERVASLYQPGHPAILRLLRHVIEAGEKHGKPVSVCGEMSSDINFTLLLVGLGVRVLSVAPPTIPDLKKLIRSVSLEDAKALATRALSFDDAVATVEFLRAETRKVLPEGQ